MAPSSCGATRRGAEWGNGPGPACLCAVRRCVPGVGDAVRTLANKKPDAEGRRALQCGELRCAAYYILYTVAGSKRRSAT